MKEKLFRGQTRRKGEYLVNYAGKKCESNWVYGGVCFGKGDFSIIYGYMDDNKEVPVEKFVVYSDTVGQYTGKDLNGEKLFDGDIVETVEDYDDTFGHPATTQFYSVVVWDEENFCWAFKTGNDLIPFNDWTWECCFKVGNIFDNPELLEVQ